jgi:hypothetical protein
VPGNKAQIDGTAEITVPNPEDAARQARHLGAVYQGYNAAFSRHELAHEPFGIVADGLELLAAHVTRRVG